MERASGASGGMTPTPSRGDDPGFGTEKSSGSISEIVMPTDVRASLAKNLNFYLSHYNPEPLGGVQREFH